MLFICFCGKIGLEVLIANTVKTKKISAVLLLSAFIAGLHFPGIVTSSAKGIDIRALTVYVQPLKNDWARGWEGCMNEGPCILKHNGTYYPTYSGDDWKNKTYAVGCSVFTVLQQHRKA